MRLVSFLSICFVLASCAQMDKKLNMALNGDKYEQSLPYREGDVISVKLNESQFYDAFISKTYRKEEVVNRFGYQGKNVLEVADIKFPNYENFFPTEIGQYQGYVSTGNILPKKGAILKIKLISVGRECETEEIMGQSRCKNTYSSEGSDFLDKAVFVGWDEETEKKAVSFVEMRKKQKKSQGRTQAILANFRNVEKNRQANPNSTKKCDSDLEDLRSDLRSVHGKSALTDYIYKNPKLINRVVECASTFMYTKAQINNLPLFLSREVTQRRLDKEDELIGTKR